MVPTTWEDPQAKAAGNATLSGTTLKNGDTGNATLSGTTLKNGNTLPGNPASRTRVGGYAFP